jgi:hypothetical protein
MTLQLKNPHLLLYIVLPCIFAVTYAIVALDELKHAVIILCLCVLFTSLLLSLLFLEHSNPSSREEEWRRNVYKVTHIIRSNIHPVWWLSNLLCVGV